MKKRMDELLRETYVFDKPDILASVPEISVTLNENERYSGTVTFRSAGGSRLRGFLVSDSRRIVLETEEITSSPAVVSFQIDSIGVLPGGRIDGSITAETSIGECRVRVHVQIKEDPPAEVNDEVKALEHFTRLAENSPAKAFRFFISEEFSGILRGKNTVYRALYRGLSRNPVTYQHMEEFLVAAGKKDPVHISTDKIEKNIYHVNATQKDTIYIYKSTWGYCHVDISLVGDFIETDKLEIASEDFIGKIYGLEFLINKEKLSLMPKYGKIVLRTVYETITIPIEASLEGGMKLLSGTFRKKRILSLIRSYLDLQLKKTDYHTWYETSSQLIRELKEEKEDGISLFGEAYLAYCNEENDRAIELLWRVKTGSYKLRNMWEKAAYLYLSKVCGLLPAEKSDIAPKLYTFYQQQPDCYLLLALYIKEDEAAPYRAVWGLNEYEKAYELGCFSPFLYYRAWKELIKQESRLRSLSPFILRVLLFAQKEGLLNENLLKRAAFLSVHEKTFRPALYRLLKEGYEQFPSDDVLESICRYAVKDDASDPAYYPWYAKAVERDIRLTRLFENYMQTRPEKDETMFPRPVTLYFSMNHTLGERKRAYLYSVIIKHKKEDSVTFENFRQEMENFALESLTAGKINDHLSVLYSEFIVPRKDLEMSSALARVAFTHILTCEDPAIRSVIVCHPSLKDESSYEVSGGVAYPNIYGPDACILLEDGKKRRFAATIPFEVRPLMDVKRSARACVDMGVWDTGLQLYCCHERGWQMDVNTRTVLSFLKAAENPEFTRKYRDRLRYKLLVYFSRQPNDPYAHKFAERIKEGTYGWVDKVRTFDLLMEFDLCEKALSLTDKLGFEELDPQKLLALADTSIYSMEYAADPVLERLCLALFDQGVWSEKTLRYLTKHFEGTPEQMEKVWLVSTRGNPDAEKMEERILLTSMFVRKVPEHAEEILEDYAKDGANAAILRAYLTFLGEHCLLENRPLSAGTAKLLAALCERKDDHLRICTLAWLKYQSGLQTHSAEEKMKIRRTMRSCDLDGLRFSFMQKLAGAVGDEIDISDKAIVEERFPCGSHVLIHYRTGDGDYRTEPMKEKIKGLFVREFLLFYNEKLEYYCTVRQGEETRDTEPKTIAASGGWSDGTTRYQILNRMLQATHEGRIETAREAARQYLKQEACVERFFEII